MWASLGLGLAAWLLAGSLTEWAGRVRLFRSSFADSFHRALHLPRSAYGMTISHMGVAVLLIGVAGSLAWQTEYLQVMRPGASAAVAGYQLKFIGVEDNVHGPNYIASRATFIVTKNGRYVTELQPERRMFTNPPQPLSTVAIHTNFVSDLYAVLGDPNGRGGFVVHIYHNPLIPWLFFGAIMMVLGRRRVADGPASPHRRAIAQTCGKNPHARDEGGCTKCRRSGSNARLRGAGRIVCRCWRSPFWPGSSSVGCIWSRRASRRT